MPKGKRLKILSFGRNCQISAMGQTHPQTDRRTSRLLNWIGLRAIKWKHLLLSTISCLCLSVPLPFLHSEAMWSGDLWLKTVFLKLQNLEDNLDQVDHDNGVHDKYDQNIEDKDGVNHNKDDQGLFWYRCYYHHSLRGWVISRMPDCLLLYANVRY